MIKRTADCFGIEPERLAGDTGYGSAEMLGWLVEERGIEPHIPVFDKSERTDGTFSRDDFRYDHDGDVYFCPSGKVLTTKGTLVNDGATLHLSGQHLRLRAVRVEAAMLPEHARSQNPAQHP